MKLLRFERNNKTRSKELIDFEIRILGLTSPHNHDQVFLTTKKCGAQRMVPPSKWSGGAPFLGDLASFLPECEWGTIFVFLPTLG